MLSRVVRVCQTDATPTSEVRNTSSPVEGESLLGNRCVEVIDIYHELRVVGDRIMAEGEKGLYN
jgi:hypothetical protein